MHWQAVIDEVEKGQVCRLQIHLQGKPVSFSEVINNWRTSKEFCRFYNQLLSKISFNAYFWETPPMLKSRLAESYECVCVNSEVLSGVIENSQPFSEYFGHDCGNELVVQFQNLGGDARLVAPCPVEKNNCYAHLAEFVRKGAQEQQLKFWQCIGQTLDNNISENPLWLSTSGLGVYWLHARLDSFPKYYTWQPYRQNSLSDERHIEH